MRLRKLFQWRNPLFWIFIALNALSSLISYLLRTQQMPLALTLVLAAFALGNMLLGIRIALHLMRMPDEGGDK
jgi:uncharacterized integral membrane protein